MNKAKEKFELYIISLWLLFLLIFIVTAQIPTCISTECSFIGVIALLKLNILPAVSAILLAAGAIFYFRFDHRISNSGSLPTSVEGLEDANYEHLTFLTTYIIPLICFNLTSVRYVIALFVLLIVIGIIYVKTNKFYANPTLAVLGFKLYTATINKKNAPIKATIITRSTITNGSNIRYIELDNNVYYARKAK